MNTSKSAITFGDWGKLAIGKHFSKILKHEAAVLKDQDPEELHQMRIGLRRLRSAMIGFAPAIILPKTATEKVTRKIGKTLGKTRDLDVLQLALKTDYLPNLPLAEQKYLAKATKVITKERKKAFKQVKSTLTGKSYLRFKQDLRDWLKKPQYTTIAATKIELILPDLLLPQVSQLLLHAGWFVGVNFTSGEIKFSKSATPKQVEKILNQEQKKLHDLRKEAKKIRYNMSLFTQFYSEKFIDYLQKIKDIQEILGTLQDDLVLKLFLEQVFNSKLEKYLPSLVKQFQQQRYQKWLAWESLQYQFLDLSTRQELRKAIVDRR